MNTGAMSEPLDLEPIKARHAAKYLPGKAYVTDSQAGVDRHALLAEVERLRGEVARQAEQIARRWPHYTSTYCIHDQHGDCRLSCKVCHSLCRCGCHEAVP